LILIVGYSSEKYHYPKLIIFINGSGLLNVYNHRNVDTYVLFTLKDEGQRKETENWEIAIFDNCVTRQISKMTDSVIKV
jgi:hypothetical protein